MGVVPKKHGANQEEFFGVKGSAGQGREGGRLRKGEQVALWFEETARRARMCEKDLVEEKNRGNCSTAKL